MEKDWTTQQVETMPAIALRGLTIFPNVLIHFDVAREISIKALEEAMTAGRRCSWLARKIWPWRSRKQKTFTPLAPSPRCGRSCACPEITCG
ncbi:MAG: hypothetical protein V8S34_04475 [Lawsonibacter sp.]